ncbi:MAG: hypothetical protein K2P98_05210 [Neisseriaceae bacterium]|nr:hypothetical protein [Neisseriaceae bacterium]
MLIDVKKEDLSSLKIQLKGDIPLTWKFDSSKGELFLTITSEQAVNDLPLRFIVFGFLPTERISREYFVSFDEQNQAKEAPDSITEASDIVLGVNPIIKKPNEVKKNDSPDSATNSSNFDFIRVPTQPQQEDWLSKMTKFGAPISDSFARLPGLLPPLLGDNLLILIFLVGFIVVLLFGRNRSTSKKGASTYSREYANSEVTSINLSARNAFEGDHTMLAELTRMVPAQLNSQAAKVDAIMEADVYLNYGRSDHAEAVLKEAIAESPLDIQYHLKLLDMFTNERNISKFDRYLPGLHKVTSGEGPFWNEAIELGKSVGSSHKLLQSGMAFAMPESAAMTKSKNNFDQLLVNTASNAAPIQSNSQGINFEFEAQMKSLNQTSLEKTSAQTDFFTPEKEEKITPVVAKTDPRVDLARVYLEMGDKAQARNILLSFLDEAAVKRIFDI